MLITFTVILLIKGAADSRKCVLKSSLDPYLFSRRGSGLCRSSTVCCNLNPSRTHGAFSRTVSCGSSSPVRTCHLSDPVGIIPWNATPGKACGATLGDICNTSEVRGHRHDRFHLLSPPPVTYSLFPPAVLPVLPPLHCRASRCRRHRHRTGKLLVVKLMMSNSYARCYGAIFRCPSNRASDVCVL